MFEKSRLLSEAGRPKLYELFVEDHPDGMFTYSPQDSLAGAISMYRVYMECEDLTEWSFANKYLLGWDHWEKLSNLKLVKPYVEAWRKDLEQKIKSKAFEAIKLEAEEGGRNSFEANKILLNGKWKELVSTQVTRGRPSKHQIDAKVQEELDMAKSVSEDLKRLGLLQ